MESRRFDADGVSFSWATWTDVGKCRDINEDSMLALPGIFAVADGMGGHGGGDVASTAAVEALACRSGTPFGIDDVPELLTDARTAVERAGREARQTLMGTTLVAVLWVGREGRDGLVVAHVGDSRCYELGPDGVHRVTRDHSVVQELIEAGELMPSEVECHPDRHVVTRAFGGGSGGDVEYVVLSPTSPQRLLLCSDGVSGPLDDRVIAESLDISRTPTEAVELLAQRVLAGTAPDNATAIVIDAIWDAAVLSAAADCGIDTRPNPRRSLDTPELSAGLNRGDVSRPPVGRSR